MFILLFCVRMSWTYLIRTLAPIMIAFRIHENVLCFLPDEKDRSGAGVTVCPRLSIHFEVVLYEEKHTVDLDGDVC